MHNSRNLAVYVLGVSVIAAMLSLQACGKKAPPKAENAAPATAAKTPTAIPKAQPGIQLPRYTAKDGVEMVEIPAGEFEMGSKAGEPDEKPVHTVKLAAFRLDVRPVTNAQFAAFLNAIGGDRELNGHLLIWTFVRGVHRVGGRWVPQNGCDQYPAVGMTWYGATAYAKHYGKRLPTEAEWEYACRAGTTGKWCSGDDASGLGAYAWYDATAGQDMHAAGGKAPNAWGLCDMHGNVWEWCADWYGEDYYSVSAKTDPKGPSTAGFRVLRGGSRLNSAERCRSANRGASTPDDKDGTIGFRCAMTVKGN
ncbi:MAG: formylglycine-generating enzyme family protein [Candidatus Coatesbacteria bacterium]